MEEEILKLLQEQVVVVHLVVEVLILQEQVQEILQVQHPLKVLMEEQVQVEEQVLIKYKEEVEELAKQVQLVVDLILLLVKVEMVLQIQ